MKQIINVTVVYDEQTNDYGYVAVPSTRAAAPDLTSAEIVDGRSKSIDLMLSDVTGRAVAKWGPVLLSFFGTSDITNAIAAAGRITPRVF